MTDGQRRLMKTITWSLIALSITTGVGWIATGSLIKGGAIGLICRAFKIPAYWLHDAAYDRVKVTEAEKVQVVHAMDGLVDIHPLW